MIANDVALFITPPPTAMSDKRFNALYGHKQLFFSTPEGRAIDVLVDRMEMCHIVDFADRIERHPVTLDVTDLLLTKLQIVRLNEKDAQDTLYLLSTFETTEGDEPGWIGLGRVAAMVPTTGADGVR